MTSENRKNSNLLLKLIRALVSICNLVGNLLKREVTAKQFVLDLKFRVIPQSKILNDDFDWDKYPNYYKQELKSTSRFHTLVIKNKSFEFKNGELIKKDSSDKDLHSNHEVLYRAILSLSPESVLEVGCGGGDHLANIHALNPSIQLFGVDRSPGQISTLNERHPNLPSKIYVADITNKDSKIETVDLVFTQAVLMHISEKDGRFKTGLNSIFLAAKQYVVLVENWSQHNFLSEIEDVKSNNSDWANSFIYYLNSKKDPMSSALIVSKNEITGMKNLVSYEQILAGRKILIH
jgi:SAM-dependent methyltransferase